MEPNKQGQNGPLKSVLIIVLVIVLWMSIWELIATAVEEWSRERRLFFYGFILVLVGVLLFTRPDLVPHLT